MKRSHLQYLSRRLLGLGTAALILIVLLLAALWAAAARLGGHWRRLAGAGALALVLLVLAAVWIVRPFLRMEREMRQSLKGHTGLSGEETVFLTPASRQALEYLRGMPDSSELMKLNKRQAQYLALQNQINPHFLYNTLESIRSEALVAGLTALAGMTEALASFFRYTISKVEDLVSVEEELQNCETYFKIQQYRFAERLQLTIECDSGEREEIYNCRLPKLTMQPILENSIIHGTECKIGTGHLKIHLERTASLLLIRISDDGVGMDEQTLARMNRQPQKSARTVAGQDAPARDGIALRNVNNRIHLLFGEEYGLRVFSMPGVGTDVEILLPAITSDRDVPNKEALRSL
ncbi:sensor histidine kinase [Oscillospiraceae bacterium 38-13]